MSGEPVSFADRRRTKLFNADAPVFREALLPLLEDAAQPRRVADAAVVLLAHVDRLTVPFNSKEFVMLFPHQQRAVARMLRKSSRPAVANELWALCFEHMDRDGRVAFDRALFAQELSVGPRVISRLMGELFRFQALLRTGTPGRYRYSINPHVGTQLGLSKALEKAQAGAPVLPLLPLSERPTERRSRARVVQPVLDA